MRRRAMLLQFATTLLIACFNAPSHAQDGASYPNRPIRVIVPAGAGAGLDFAARITAEAVEKYLGQRFIIENRPGAGQRLGTAVVAKSPPDGYTLLFCAPAPIVVVQFFPQKLDYDPVHDLAAIAIAVYQPALLIVRPTLGVKSVAEFVAHVKANPGKTTFGIQGFGSEMHLMLEVLKSQAGIEVNAVPYNVANQAIVDLLADRLDAMFLVIPPIKGHLDSGKLRAIATISDRRVSQYPDIPTMIELGLPKVTNSIWFGYLAPAGTPQPIIDRLADAFGKLQSNATLVQRLADAGADLNIVGPKEFGRIIKDDRSRYGAIVSERNLAKAN